MSSNYAPPGETTPWFTALAAELQSTATRTSDWIWVRNGEGLAFLVIVANEAGSCSFTPSIITEDPDATERTLWTAAAAIVANSTVSYWIGPAAVTGAFTESKSAPIARKVKIRLTYAGTPANDKMDTKVFAFLHAGG